MDKILSPKISIIIPVYNIQKYLRECLDSAIGQTFCDIEIICVNDGSTDDSQNIIDEYAERDSRIVKVEKFNGGLSSARNAGMDVARGKYILFFDSDDIVDSELCARTFEKAEVLNADLVFFNAIHFTCGCISSKCFFNYPDVEGIFCPRNFPLVLMQVSAWNRLYRRELVKNVRFIDGLYFEDQPFSAEVNIIAERAAIIDQSLYYYRKDNQSCITMNPQTSMGIFSSFDALKQVLDKYDKKDELYNSVYATVELVNYKNRFTLLPAQYCFAFFANARKHLSDANWYLLLSNCQEYDAKYWPWSRSDNYFVGCLRYAGFWAYAPKLVIDNWRNIKYIIFSLPIFGRIFEWFYAFMSIRRYSPCTSKNFNACD